MFDFIFTKSVPYSTFPQLPSTQSTHSQMPFNITFDESNILSKCLFSCIFPLPNNVKYNHKYSYELNYYRLLLLLMVIQTVHPFLLCIHKYNSINNIIAKNSRYMCYLNVPNTKYLCTYPEKYRIEKIINKSIIFHIKFGCK